MQASTVVTLKVYRKPMEMVIEFKYLGRALTTYENSCVEVVDNICKARSRWARFPRILGQEGEDPRTSDTFYKAFVQLALLF